MSCRDSEAGKSKWGLIGFFLRIFILCTAKLEELKQVVVLHVVVFLSSVVIRSKRVPRCEKMKIFPTVFAKKGDCLCLYRVRGLRYCCICELGSDCVKKIINLNA